jgi:hypothetical protein
MDCETSVGKISRPNPSEKQLGHKPDAENPQKDDYQADKVKTSSRSGQVREWAAGWQIEAPSSQAVRFDTRGRF